VVAAAKVSVAAAAGTVRHAQRHQRALRSAGALPQQARPVLRDIVNIVPNNDSSSDPCFYIKPKGITLKPSGKWEAQVSLVNEEGDVISGYLGLYITDVEAAKAFDRSMIWFEEHGVIRVRGGTGLNFHKDCYSGDVNRLRAIATSKTALIKDRVRELRNHLVKW